MSDLRDAVRAGLEARRDPERAAKQQAYMKSAMPFYGIGAPETRRVTRAALKAHPIGRPEDYRREVRELWDGADHREERYAALTVLRAPAHRRWATDPAMAPFLRELLVDGAWWDLVDETSSAVGELLRAHPDVITPVLREWSRDPNVWVRRSSIISQLAFKDQTDLDLLAYAIDGSMDDRDFFARKAIGWALRQHAKTDPEWVRAFVAAHQARLSPLSKREALKQIGPA